MLLALVASILIPLLDIPFKTTNYGLFGKFVVNSKEFLNTNMIEEVVVTAVDKNHFISYQYFAMFYLLGVFLFSLRFFKNLFQLIYWIINSNSINQNGTKVVILDDDFPPFSFLTTVFVSNKDYHKKEFPSILAHEKAHINQLHTFDILFIETLTVIFWLNPLVWMYKKSIQEIHEYLADQKAVSVVDSANDYKKHLVNQFAGADLFRIGSNFGQLSLKKRIAMMGKIQSPKLALIKFLLLFPIIALLLAAFAFTVKEEKKLTSNNNYKFIIPRFFKNRHNNDIQFITEYPVTGIQKLEYKKSNNNIVNTKADVMPQFTGGEKALHDAINKNFIYPPQAISKKIEGNVLIGFIINKVGRIEQPQILKSCHPILDSAAIKAITELDKWQPAIKNGNTIAIECSLPLCFSLAKQNISPVFKQTSTNGSTVNNRTFLLHQ